MSGSLKDQLLGLGFKPAAKPETRPAPPKPAHKHARKPVPVKSARPATATPGAPDGIDLAKAFALRSQQEQRERAQAEREKQEAAQRKKQAKQAVAALLDGKLLNAPEADIARHFSYGGKIKRIYVTAAQLAALNAGELGVVQHDGRYCLVDADTLLAVRALLPALAALYCDGSEERLPEDYDDPKFQVPDDLLW